MRRLWMLCLLVCSPAALASDWQVDHAASRLGFHTTQQDGKLDGEFRQWDAVIHFDPDHLEASVIDVTVQIGSITTGSRQRDKFLPEEEWFYTKQFPDASFHATRVEAHGDGYVARGELTLRGITQPIDLQFTWAGEGDSAEVHARTALERIRFGIGEGEFADSDVVGLEVQVMADLSLHR
jgi:polyisoprenoid-binding protein YceI